MMEENKRTTAPVSSVAADVGQSNNKSNDIISEEAQKDNLYTEKNTEDMQACAENATDAKSKLSPHDRDRGFDGYDLPSQADSD